jgi:hypothetical protein
MDKDVLDAIARWPDVPSVFGWLSLTARGQWRLHPDGKATEGGPGESIQNTQIQRFINRNYTCDEQGRWFFQNGPQRVFVRLDAAPLIASVDTGNGTILSHLGETLSDITAWFIDSEGRVYFESSQGAGFVIDRDLGTLADTLKTPEGQTLAQWWESGVGGQTEGQGEEQAKTIAQTRVSDPSGRYPVLSETRPLTRLTDFESVPARLGFIGNPQPPAETELNAVSP